jgi:hypothetical protein
LLTTLPTVTCIRYILNCLRSFPQQTRLGRHGDSRLRGVGVSVHAIRVEQSFDRTFRFQFLSIHEALRLPVRPDTFSNFSSVSPCVQPAVLVLGTHSVSARGTRFYRSGQGRPVHRRTARLHLLPCCDCSCVFHVFFAFACARVVFFCSEKTYSSRVDRRSQQMRTTVATR